MLGHYKCPQCGSDVPDAVVVSVLADGLALLASSVLVKGESRLAVDLATMADATRKTLEKRAS